MSILETEPIIIAGPCAAESRQQVVTSAVEVKRLGADGLRACLWKPRTEPDGFEGAGEEGIRWLAEAASLGITVGTEVMLPEQADALTRHLFDLQANAQLIVWIGSRNQNHMVQRDIARAVSGDPRVLLMIKNQPWPDERHWLGIHSHILSAGFPEDSILLCHRGYAPSKNGLRNPPDFDMAMRVKEATGRPMILDPSHIGGSPLNVLQVVRDSLQFDFDGVMVEVHPDPENALTDKRQQLTFKQLAYLLEIVQTKT